MTRVQRLPTRPSPPRMSARVAEGDARHPDPAAVAVSPVLIKVSKARSARPPSASARARLLAYRTDGLDTRPRRRLRREFRAAAFVLTAAAPLVVAFVLLRGVPGFLSGAREGRRGAVPAARPPLVSLLSIEPPGRDPEPPVVFPGYLLPPDVGTEEPDHAGG